MIVLTGFQRKKHFLPINIYYFSYDNYFIFHNLLNIHEKINVLFSQNFKCVLFLVHIWKVFNTCKYVIC